MCLSEMSNIEEVLNKLKNDNIENLNKVVTEYLLSICKFANIVVDNKNDGINIASLINIVFSNDITVQQKEIIAVCLLRLLCNNENIIWNNAEFRLKTFALFDELFSNKVYKILGIKSNEKNHEKLLKLRDVETKTLTEFKKVTDTITSLKNAIDIRQRFMKLLRNPLHRLFLKYFTNEAVISTVRIKELFESITEYSESGLINSIPCYTNIEKVFDLFIDDAGKCPSIYTNKCLIIPIKKILEIIKENFSNSNVIKPANVHIKNKLRKYPFHIPDRRIEIKFIVENKGLGYAFDVQVEIIEAKGFLVLNSMIKLGNLEISENEIVFEVKTNEKMEKSFDILGEISWYNFNNPEIIKVDFLFKLTPQRDDLDWDELSSKKPYSIEAIEKEDELVGRTVTMNALFARLTNEPIESSIISGQKRVGKTSIAKTIQTKLLDKQNYTTIYILINDLDKITPIKFINHLSKRIAGEISLVPDFRDIERPIFDGALAPLIDYLIKLKRIKSQHKFVFIFDEFDEIPIDLYHDTAISDTFWGNIRGLSQISHIGIILIGGENMQLLIEATDRLNNFDTDKIDYFNKDTYWHDFQELVKRPVVNAIEYSDNSIVRLYEITEGNPFYTNLICRKVYSKACNTRNSYISTDEIDESIRESMSSLNINHINHFWKDFIQVDDSVLKDKIETQRRKFLIAYASIKRQNGCVLKQNLHDFESLSDVDVDEMIENFRVRNILIDENDSYRLKPRFFEKWLIELGIQVLSTSFSDKEAMTMFKNIEEQAYITDKELAELADSWGLYKSSEITTSKIRNWLDQFEKNTEKRYMFILLQNIKFYKDIEVREKLRIIHEKVKKETTYDKQIKERYRHDILLSSFGNPSKSWSSYSRLYANENKIINTNVALMGDIATAIEKNSRIKCIVIIDDIIGSGDTACKALGEIGKLHGKTLKTNGIKLIISAICGFREGVNKLIEKMNNIEFEATVCIANIFDESDQCFCDKSEYFETDSDRKEAKKIALKYGKKIEKKIPLGHCNNQALIVFFDSCPDNCLSILWASSKGYNSWTPLFKDN